MFITSWLCSCILLALEWHVRFFFIPSILVWVTSYPIAIGIIPPPFCRVVNIFEFFFVFFLVSLSTSFILINLCDMKMLVDHFFKCVEKCAFHSYGDFINQHGGKHSTWLSRDTLETSFSCKCLEIIWFILHMNRHVVGI